MIAPSKDNGVSISIDVIFLPDLLSTLTIPRSKDCEVSLIFAPILEKYKPRYSYFDSLGIGHLL